jgi:hypothetical protein
MEVNHFHFVLQKELFKSMTGNMSCRCTTAKVLFVSYRVNGTSISIDIIYIFGGELYLIYDQLK